jgi:hypothetical protein
MTANAGQLFTSVARGGPLQPLNGRHSGPLSEIARGSQVFSQSLSPQESTRSIGGNGALSPIAYDRRKALTLRRSSRQEASGWRPRWRLSRNGCSDDAAGEWAEIGSTHSSLGT